MSFKVKIAVGILLLLLVFILFGVLYSRKNSVVAPESQIEQTTAVENKIEEDLPSFPLYQGVSIQEKDYRKTQDGYSLQSVLDESVENIIFSYYDEMVEDGWEILEEPDTSNAQLQTFKAQSPDGMIAAFRAEARNGKTYLEINLEVPSKNNE